MNCKICNSQAKPLFKKKVLGKYDVQYYLCANCGFMQTEKPYWLKEAYSDAITAQDVGLVQRNLNLVKTTKKVISNNFDITAKFLDWGGGYGLFTRLMRDEGLDFYHHDPYCENLFAKSFEGQGNNYELVTSFEVLEHLEDPVASFADMFSFGDSLLFTEELIPPNNIAEWWYIAPEHGQHISFFSRKSLELVAEKYGAHVVSKENLHLMTKKVMNIKLPSMQESSFKRISKKFRNRFNYHILGKPRLTPLTGRDFRDSKKLSK